MKVQVKHFGSVKGGRTIFKNQTLYFQQLTQLEGKEFELIIKERLKRPTLDQAGFYFGAVLGSCYESEMFSHFDNPYQIHKEYFAPKFLSYTKIVTVGNQKHQITLIRSLTELDRKETSDLIERAVADCALNSIIILSPEEYFIKNYSK